MKVKIFVGPPRSGKSSEAQMIEKGIGKENTSWINARRIRNEINEPFFFFNKLSLEVDLIVFDDCNIEFDYSFFHRAKIEHDGELTFLIEWCRLGHWAKMINVKNIIITTNRIDSKWVAMPWFLNCFDIIEFPN